MLNLFINTNNFSLFDHNLFNYVFILGSISVIGFSMYYFSSTSFKYNESIVTDSLPTSQDIYVKQIFENLKPKAVENLDNIVPTMSNFKDLVSQGVNTDGPNLVDSAVQTEDQMLYEYLRELLYNDATPVTSLGEISPTEFVREYRNDPALSSYFEKTANWAESISRQSSGTSANSEILFLRKINEDLISITELIQNNPHSVRESFITHVSEDGANIISPISEQICLMDISAETFNKVNGKIGMTAEELSMSLIEQAQLLDSIRQVYELGCF
jgi:hypothetical protein